MLGSGRRIISTGRKGKAGRGLLFPASYNKQPLENEAYWGWLWPSVGLVARLTGSSTWICRSAFTSVNV